MNLGRVRLKISTKIILLVCSSIAISATLCIIVENRAILDQGVALKVDQMRVALSEAEDVRGSIAKLRDKGAFDNAALLEELKQGKKIEETALYGTIPVVAAWQSLEHTSKDRNWNFRVVKHQARNKKTSPTAWRRAFSNTSKRRTARNMCTWIMRKMYSFSRTQSG